MKKFAWVCVVAGIIAFMCYLTEQQRKAKAEVANARKLVQVSAGAIAVQERKLARDIEQLRETVSRIAKASAERKSAAEIWREAPYIVMLRKIVKGPTGLRRVEAAGSGSVTKYDNAFCVISATHATGCDVNETVVQFFACFRNYEGAALAPEELDAPRCDLRRDVCAYQFKNKNFVFPWKTANWVSAATLSQGDAVFALGAPRGSGAESLERGLAHFTITEGIVMSVARDLLESGEFARVDFHARLIEHTATMNPGNSGGPLVNERGDVVGVNVMRQRHAIKEGVGKTPNMPAKTEQLDRYIYFAAPADYIIDGLGSLIAGVTPKHGKTNMKLVNSWEFIPEELRVGADYRKNKASGVIVARPRENCPALKVWDIILSVDGVRPKDWNAVEEAAEKKSPGETLQLVVEHDDGSTETILLPVE